ncbi:MAG: hypothetical protein ACI9XO_002131 [Paraglaciecola sp.]|jgi:hypothetical protein
MKNLLFVLTGILFLISCESNPYVTSSIEMNMGACFGACPVYKITISGDGTVSYDGQKNVPKMGEYNKQLSPEETKTLFDAFAASNFFAFEEEYMSNISDLPTTFISFQNGGKSKKIKDYYGAPDELDALEHRVEEIVNSTEWTKVE